MSPSSGAIVGIRQLYRAILEEFPLPLGGGGGGTGFPNDFKLAGHVSNHHGRGRGR